MQQPDDKTLARMRKLLELAKQGVGGEAANAERFLARMLAKHGMQLSDITGDDQQRSKVEIKWRTAENRKLILQIIAKVRNDAQFDMWVRPGKKVVVVELSPAEHAEVLMHEAALTPALATHMRRALSAFVQVNHLYPDPDGHSDEKPSKPMDKEELAAIMMMMSATQKTTVLKALPKPA